MAQSLAVAVIGAGVAGLVAARELQREGHQVVIFEKSDRVGGLWNYDPRTESDSLSQDPSREIVHSSLYHSLRTNLPRVLMSFSDFAFEEREYGDPRAFPGHLEVLAFLNDFATQFGIGELVRFNSEVVRVERVEEDKWVVEWREGAKLDEDVFEGVVVCNGHSTLPQLADIPGVEKWPGKQIHSHNYCVPAPFKDQVVVVIGSGPSGSDISQDISKDGTIEFEDGSSVQANIILHCTGYKYEFPFLKTNGIVSIDDNRVGPLYKHVFPPQLAPSLSFVGLPHKIIIFDMMELQSKWVARVLSGKVSLPSEQEMMRDVKEYYQQMTIQKRLMHLTHYLPNSKEYLDWLAAQAGSSPLEDWKINIFREILKRIENHQDGFRDEIDVDEWRTRI